MYLFVGEEAFACPGDREGEQLTLRLCWCVVYHLLSPYSLFITARYAL
jgi:hypothetical protein